MKLKKFSMAVTLFAVTIFMLSIDTNARGAVSRDQATYSDAEMDRMIAQQYKALREAYNTADAFKLTKKVDKIDSFLIDFSFDPLADKKITFIGDSITAGNGGTITPDGTKRGYPDYIAQYTDATIVNLGIGGAQVSGDSSKAIVNRYEQIPEDSDIIVFFAGINDFLNENVSCGSESHDDEGTFYGDTKTCFEGISERYPDADVYVVTTYHNRLEDYTAYSGKNMKQFMTALTELARDYGFHIIDLYEEGFLNTNHILVRNAFFTDDIHPDDLGAEVLGRHILMHLERQYR
ncbi:MAG: SGNH/GDSL hydrolase family protein [Lachnospiraceae bacterium]|nr:SGNH/GDSL hydrolase family protein [Lachnospiraceae bacterium]